MRRSRAVVTLVLLVVSALWAAGPAAAGGPTSVLLSVPGEGRTASLYYSDADYQALSELVGLLGPADSSSASQGSHQTGDVVTLTWLIHDVQVWRVDRVYLGGPDGAWVQTQQDSSGGSIWEAPAVWHRAGAQLPALLARVLPETGSATGPGTAPAPVAVPDTPAPAPAASVVTASPLTLAAWTAGGLAVGAMLTLLIVRRQGRRPTAAVDDRPTATDQLAWP